MLGCCWSVLDGVSAGVAVALLESSSATGEQVSARTLCARPWRPLPLRLPSLLHSRLEPLRSSFSEELVMVAMIPLSLLSSVELGLVMVPQGLERLSGGRLVVLFRVEHGLSVLGDAVLLVSVEQGLMPWLVREHFFSFLSSIGMRAVPGIPSPSKKPSLVISS